MVTLENVIDHTAAVTSIEELGEYYLSLTRELGFDVASFHMLQRGLYPHKQGDIPLLHNFPHAWMDYYVSHHCMLHDPIIAQAQKERLPFHWFRVNELRALNPQEEAYLQLLKDAGYTDGLAIPLYGPGGEVAYAGLGMRHGTIDLTPKQLSLLHYSLYEIFYRCQELRDEMRENAPTLTPRESEILLWVSRGKSNEVIAEILSISDHTVDSLLRRIYRKLGVFSRVAAVVKATQWGLISPYI